MKQKEKVIRKYNPLIIKLAIEMKIQMQSKIEIHHIEASESKIIIKIVKYYSMYYTRETKDRNKGKGKEIVKGEKCRKREERERDNRHPTGSHYHRPDHG